MNVKLPLSAAVAGILIAIPLMAWAAQETTPERPVTAEDSTEVGIQCPMVGDWEDMQTYMQDHWEEMESFMDDHWTESGTFGHGPMMGGPRMRQG